MRLLPWCELGWGDVTAQDNARLNGGVRLRRLCGCVGLNGGVGLCGCVRLNGGVGLCGCVRLNGGVLRGRAELGI